MERSGILIHLMTERSEILILLRKHSTWFYKRDRKVGAEGFEPSTSRTRTVRATGLRYAPMSAIIGQFACSAKCQQPAIAWEVIDALIWV